MLLKGLAATGEHGHAGRLTPEFNIDVLSGQHRKLERKMADLRVMTRYLRAKIAWIADGEQG